MSTNVTSITRGLVGLVLFCIFLMSCTYKQEIRGNEDLINSESFENVSLRGNYSAVLYKKSELHGDALHLGTFCSAHRYPYEFDALFETTISMVLDKVYETVEFEVAADGKQETGDGKIVISVEPADIRVMCPPLSPTKQVCVATAKLSAKVGNGEKAPTMISVETRHSVPSGGACSGGGKAVSVSIGMAIHEFSGKLYTYLAAD